MLRYCFIQFFFLLSFEIVVVDIYFLQYLVLSPYLLQ